MKRWALIMVALYGLFFFAMAAPTILWAFGPNAAKTVLSRGWEWLMGNPAAFATSSANSIEPHEAMEVYLMWPLWAWVVAMMLGQAALLLVPVKVASRRPVTRRALFWPVLATGAMMGFLALGAVFSIGEFIYKGGSSEVSSSRSTWIAWSAVTVGIALWCGWTAVFVRLSRGREPSDVVARQCRYLLQGSVLELLIAVPTHLVARYRDYCCAGFMTFVGLVAGISVMLFSFGPGIYFLFVDRWKKLHPPRQDNVS